MPTVDRSNEINVTLPESISLEGGANASDHEGLVPVGEFSARATEHGDIASARLRSAHVKH
jgi:hypothetical protein